MGRNPGSSLTPQEKQEKLAQLARYIRAGMSYAEMADRLDVSQATVYTWKLMVMSQMLPELIEEKIAQELVCCDVYAQGEPLRALRRGQDGWADAQVKLRQLMNRHPACYWGGAAAAIAKTFAQPR